ncbi:MAG: lipid-A-disaccharide synthase, partial [Planctomycetota bacterium]|nr:lipid-A-disaccharide synthase [Planctomycetota bacterium]
LPRASTLPADSVASMLASPGSPEVVVVDDAWPEVLGALDAAWVASGTASLEAALARVPSSIAYRVHPLTWFIARRLVRVDHAGLPNLVVGERLVPERMQSECTPERLAEDLDRWLRDPAAREAHREELGRVRTALGRGGAYAAAAEALEPHLRRRPD